MECQQKYGSLTALLEVSCTKAKAADTYTCFALLTADMDWEEESKPCLAQGFPQCGYTEQLAQSM